MVSNNIFFSAKNSNYQTNYEIYSKKSNNITSNNFICKEANNKIEIKRKPILLGKKNKLWD